MQTEANVLKVVSGISRHIMKELIGKIARALVDQPELASVTEIGGKHPSLVELRGDPDDIGKFSCDVSPTVWFGGMALYIIGGRSYA